MQNTGTATTKWGDIGDWDVSGVEDFSYSLSPHRDQAGGSYVNNGNPEAATFVGTAISKWNTASATTLSATFEGASVMNADLTGWKVGKVVTLANTFYGASKFIGTGLSAWDTVSVKTLENTFYYATTFVGTGLDSWDTTSITSLHYTFFGANAMNVDLSGWSVAKVTTLDHTFFGASKYAGAGLAAWDIAYVTKMVNAFDGTNALTVCNKRLISDSWKSNAAFNTQYLTAWADIECPGTPTSTPTSITPPPTAPAATPLPPEITALNTSFHKQLVVAKNTSAALDILDKMLDNYMDYQDNLQLAPSISLVVVTNLQAVASLPNSTAQRRRRIADTVSASLYSIGSGSGSEAAQATVPAGETWDLLFAKTVAIVAAVVRATSEVGATLEVGTSQGLLEAASSTLRLTAKSGGPTPDSDNTPSKRAAFDRRTIIKSVEAVAGATNRSSPATTVVTRSIAFRRQTVTPVQDDGGNTGDGDVGVGGDDLVDFSSYGGRINDDSGTEDNRGGNGNGDRPDVQGLAPPSRIQISASLFTSQITTNQAEAFIFQYSAAANVRTPTLPPSPPRALLSSLYSCITCFT